MTLFGMISSESQRLASLAKDLSKEFPRSPRDLIAGCVVGARTLDQCCAFLNIDYFLTFMTPKKTACSYCNGLAL